MGIMHEKVIEFLRENEHKFRGGLIPLKEYDLIMSRKLFGCKKKESRAILTELEDGGYPIHVNNKGIRVVKANE